MDKEQATEILKKLITTMNTQDNRATATPYYYVVRGTKWRLAKDGYAHGRTKLIRYCQDMCQEFSDFEEYKKARIEQGYCDESDPEVNDPAKSWGRLEEHELEQYNEDENVFFTEDGYKRHMQLNGHNYRGGAEPVYSYVKHAFRNPELTEMFEAIGALVGVPYERK